MSVTPRLPPTCAHCKTIQTMPEWSENAGDNEIAFFWRCSTCGQEFETREHLVDPQMSKDELVETFLPDLVVE